ncbi:MAG: HepT-like ribonuclease domain-containing protein [Shinella zoogloeoides]|uniref:HepT-like ribonuclease domain-containing protein n=1 Tax=Shinella zoogloeoides TaxID=352475 RepID=UPI003C78178E
MSCPSRSKRTVYAKMSSGSASLPSSRPKTRLLDIAENAQTILEYTAGMDRDAFEKDRRTRDATERCLSRISEAAVKLGAQAEAMLPQHPWRQTERSSGRLS